MSTAINTTNILNHGLKTYCDDCQADRRWHHGNTFRATVRLCPTHAAVAELKAENERLKAHIADINHDFAATLAHCDQFHVEGREI